jgi:hypothetical protein
LHRDLHEAAERRDISANLLIVKALRRYLEQIVPVDDENAHAAPAGGVPSAV